MSSLDGREFRRILGHYPTGVCAITTMSDDGPIGMLVGSFTSVSLDPPLVAFLPDRRSATWRRIEPTGQFCVNVLANHQQHLCTSLSRPFENRFDGISHRISANGLPILDGVVAWIDCQLDAVHEAGDHFIVIGRVRSLAVERAGPPLIFLQGGYGSVSSLEHNAHAAA